VGRGQIVIPLRNVYGSAAYCGASVLRWISEVCHGNEELQNQGRRGRPDQHETDTAILQEEPNILLSRIIEILSISPGRVHVHGSRRGCNPKTLGRSSHALTCELKQVLLSMNLQLFPKLRAHTHNNWRHLVTGDESWFYGEYGRDQTWTARDENTTEVENMTAASRKVWWPDDGVPTNSVLLQCFLRELH
jgi:hypothetical protein